MESEGKPSIKNALTKTTAANIGALIAIIGGLIYGILFKDPETVKSLALFGAGYLFGRSTTK